MIVDPYGSIVAQTSDMQPYKPAFCLADIVSPLFYRPSIDKFLKLTSNLSSIRTWTPWSMCERRCRSGASEDRTYTLPFTNDCCDCMVIVTLHIYTRIHTHCYYYTHW